MRNATSYQELEPFQDPSDALENLDWSQDWPTTVQEAALLLNEAISDEYGDLGQFHHRLTGCGFAESIAAGTTVREMLESVPEDSKAETLATALDHASTRSDGVSLAYRREYYELDELGWPQPDSETEAGLYETAGVLAYQEILLAREILKLSAYLCATPGEFGPKKEEYFLDAAKAAYQTTLSENGETPEQILASTDLSYRRIAYVARNHMESVLDHIPDDFPAEQEVRTVIKYLDETNASNGAQLLHHTAQSLWKVLEIDGTVTDFEQNKFYQLAQMALESGHLAELNGKNDSNTLYQHLNSEQIIEMMAYDAVANMRQMGYRNEQEVVADIGSDDWNRVCAGLEAISSSTQQQYRGIIAKHILFMSSKNPAHDEAAARHRHLETILNTGEDTVAYTPAASDAMQALQHAGAPELAIKLDQLMTDSQSCNLLRMAPAVQFPPHAQMFPAERHYHYDDLIAMLPEIVEDQIHIPGNDYPPDYIERANHEVNRMGLRLMSEVQERLLEQLHGCGRLVDTAKQHQLSESVTERLRTFQANAEQTAITGMEQLPTQHQIENAAALAGVTLALQDCTTRRDESNIMHLLDTMETNQAAAAAQAKQMLHPMVCTALEAAKETAANWTEEQLADGLYGYEVRYADLQYMKTDGGRMQWIMESGQEQTMERYAGDCTVRALAVAIGQEKAYGQIWSEITQCLKDDTRDADGGAKAMQIHDTYASYGLVSIYIDSQLPHGSAQRAIDMREIPEALSHLFNNSETPLTYIVNTYDHVVAIVDGTLNDDRDTRQMGEEDNQGASGRVHAFWLKSEDPDLIQTARNDFARYARVRTNSAA